MHVLLFLLVLALLPALAQTMLGVLGIIYLLVLVLLAFLMLPWWIAAPGVILLFWLFRRDVQAKVDRDAAISAHIRELERTAKDLSVDFKERANAQHAAFRLRSQINDWEGWP